MIPRQTILGYTLKQEISITTSAITGKRCTVRFQGENAYTDGSVITLPATDDASLYEVPKANIVRGYGNHEGNHHIYTPLSEILKLRNDVAGMDLTDPAVVKRLGTAPMDKAWRARVFETFNLWNASEDWRIEHHGMRDWPGTRINLDATRLHVNQREAVEIRKHPDSLYRPFETASALLTWMNAVENGYSCASIAAESIAFVRTIHPALVDIVEPVWPQIVATVDLDDLAANRRIWEISLALCNTLIAVYLQDQPPPPPDPDAPPSQDEATGGQGTTPEDQGKGPGDGSPAPSDPDTASSGSPSQTPPAPADDQSGAKDPQAAGRGQGDDTPDSPQGDAPPGKPSGQDDRDAGTQAGGGAADPGARPDDDGTDDTADGGLTKGRAAAKRAKCQIRNQLDVTDALKEFAAVAKDLERQGATISRTSLADEIVRLPRTSGSEHIAQYRSAQTEIAAVTSALTGSMRSLVIARDRRRTRYNREDGDLDMGDVLGMAMRSPDIYHQTIVHPANNTAITFLLDISASMLQRGAHTKKKRVRVACEALIALLEALGAAKRVFTRFEAYTSQSEHPTTRVMKDFNEGPPAAKAEIGRLLDDIETKKLRMGGTPTGELMLDAWNVLRRRKEPKRVLFLITDGEPDDEDLANRAAQAIKAEGGIVIGIGVGDEPHFDLDHWILVPVVEELPVKIMGAIRTIVS